MLLGLTSVLMFFVANVYKPPVIEQMGNLLFDRYQNWKPRIYRPDVPVRIIDIDNASLKSLGQWPWPRTIVARMNDRLTQAGAAVIAYDVVFSEPDRTSPESILSVLQDNPKATDQLSVIASLDKHDDIFAQSLTRSNVVLGFFLVPAQTQSSPTQSTGFTYSWDVTIDAQGNVEDINKIDTYPGAFAAIPALGRAAAGEGFVSFNPKGDGIIRKAPMIYKYGGKLYPSLSAEAIRAVQGAGAFQIKSSDGSGQIGTTSNRSMAYLQTGNFSWPVTEDGGFQVYFTEPSAELDDLRYISAATILDESIPISTWQEKVQGNLIFIGTSAEGLKDIVTTPMRGGEPGVLAHAQIAEQILGETLFGGQILKRPYWAPQLESFAILLFGLMLVFTLPWLNAVWGAFLSLAVSLCVIAFSWYSFSASLTLVNPIYVLFTVLATYGLMTLLSFYMTESERSRIKSAFSMYLSPTMVKKVSDDPGLLTLGGEERVMTILFLDIRSFSKISESLTPQEITTFLNIFLTPMTNILQDTKATIDKYIGDAIVAFWNAPLDDEEHERNAAKAVLQMNSELTALNAKYAKQDAINWPHNVSMGIGLNTGICCVGNLGSEQRFSYSMIGDAANLASRIEGLTKQYRVSSLIGDSTAQALDDFAILEADLLTVVGRETPERIWVLAGDDKDADSSEFEDLKKVHNNFLKKYRAQDWELAQSLIPELKRQASMFEFEGYYDVMNDRINSYRENPPEEKWEGIYAATSK
jgi:adenylate cyclase